MNINSILILLSSLSFFAYVISYFRSPHMKNEFKRFGLEKLGIVTIFFELLGAIGLLVGLLYNPILIISSFGLALLMFLGVIVRIKIKDSIWISLPAVAYMALNIYIFWEAIK